MRPWSTQEIRVLKAYAPLGKDALALLLERPARQIKWAATTHSISLAISEDDIEAATDIVDKVRDTPGLAICPMCGRRFARMKTTGMCRCCHLEQLLDVHQEQLDEQIRLRKLDKARQDKRRVRVCDRCGRPFYPRPSSTDRLCQECA